MLWHDIQQPSKNRRQEFRMSVDTFKSCKIMHFFDVHLKLALFIPLRQSERIRDSLPNERKTGLKARILILQPVTHCAPKTLPVGETNQ
jgi:hypothetical protein